MECHHALAHETFQLYASDYVERCMMFSTFPLTLYIATQPKMLIDKYVQDMMSCQ